MDIRGSKINVAVIMGGQSSEHEVSMSSGLAVVQALDPAKYNVKVIKIGKDGRWLVQPGYLKELPGKVDLMALEKTVSGITPVNPNMALDQADGDAVDVVFLALHGKFGEDGSLQGLLQVAGLPYTGSGVLASALAMDKEKTNEIYAFHGLNVPEYFVLHKKTHPDEETITNQVEKNLGFPVVLKPVDGGSSVGTFIIKTKSELARYIDQDFNLSDKLMLQKFISGDELTCSVLDAEAGPRALPPTLILAKKAEFYDYTAKYETGGSEHIIPAPYPAEKIKEIQKVALTAHKILGCRGLTRTDMIMEKNGRIYVLETNTIPGMTPTSLAPEAARAAGISFTQLLDMLIASAQKK